MHVTRRTGRLHAATPGLTVGTDETTSVPWSASELMPRSASATPIVAMRLVAIGVVTAGRAGEQKL